MLTAAGRVVCRAVGTTAWAVLIDIALDAEADAHGNLVAHANVRCIVANLGISKDTAARALSRPVEGGLVVGHCRRRPGRRSLGAPVVSTVLAGFVEVGAGLDQPGAQVPAHLSPSPVATRLTRHRSQALTVDHPELAYRPHTDTDDLTTTAPSALNPVRDDLTTTEPSALNPARDDLTTNATTIASTATNHGQNLSRHWHPAVPFPGAAVTGTAQAAKAAPC